MDGITMLKDDHRTVERMFKQFEKSDEAQEKRAIVDEIIQSLTAHAFIEEQVFYPMAREQVPDAGDQVLESLEEHHIVVWTLRELEDLDAADEHFDAKVSVLMENVRHHVNEEESELFPKVREALGRTRLREIGERMAEVRQQAPSEPQPARTVREAAPRPA